MKRSPLRPVGNGKTTLIIVGIAASLMIVIRLFVMGDWQYIFPKKPDVAAVEYVPVEELYNLPESVVEDYAEEGVDKPVDNLSMPLDSWKNFAVDYSPTGKGKVVLIIDDLGENLARSQEVIDLPAPLTLAFLPDVEELQLQADVARGAGHELLIHAPMEPMGGTDLLGDLALLDGMDADQAAVFMEALLGSFEGYIGINNHMGSRVTQNEALMRVVMEALKDRGLVYVDSKTVSTSVAQDMARRVGIYHGARDIFLDHEASAEFVAGALRKVEARALRDGVAIAIGHPKRVTIDALRAWIPTLADKGLELAPVSAVLHAPERLVQR